MSYLTRIQADILPFLRIEQRKNMFDYNSDIVPTSYKDIKTLFIDLIEYSFRGYQGYLFANDLLKHKKLLFTPIDTFVLWCKDIIDYSYPNKQLCIEVYKEVISEYFDIDRLNKNLYFIKGDYCFQDYKELTFKFLQKVCKFDIEELAKKGIINEDIFAEKFDCNKKYYLINHVDPNFYDNVFSFEEVKEFIAKHKKYCAITKDGFISIKRISGKPTIKGQRWKYAFENFIVAEDTLDNIKGIDDTIEEAIKNNDWETIRYLGKIISEYHNYNSYKRLYS